MSHSRPAVKPNRTRRWVTLIALLLVWGSSQFWMFHNLELDHKGMLIDDETHWDVWRGSYQLRFCGRVVDAAGSNPWVDANETKADFTRVRIEYCCLLVFIPVLTGVYAGGLANVIWRLTCQPRRGVGE